MAELDLQATWCDGMSGTGFHLRIPGRITTLFTSLGMEELEHGGFKVMPMQMEIFRSKFPIVD